MKVVKRKDLLIYVDLYSRMNIFIVWINGVLKI